MSRPSDDAIWASISSTLREVVLPAVDDDWVRQSVIQLAGLAEYARRRPDDDHDERRRLLRVALDGLADNPLVPWPPGDGDQDHHHDEDALEADVAAIALTAAVGRDDPSAAEVRDVLRPLLLAGLDADLADTEVLEDPFRGRLPGGQGPPEPRADA